MDTNKHKWYEKYFGKTLIKCNESEAVTSENVQRIIENSNYIGLYFSFANINDELSEKLKILYDNLNESEEQRQLEIIQIVLWVNNDVFDSRNDFFKEKLNEFPWYAFQFDEVEIKARLSRKFRIKSGVPTLILLDKNGVVITNVAHEKLLEDPTGLNFPWRPRPLDQILHEISLIPGGGATSNANRSAIYQDLNGVTGFYFSANWCPPCRAFTPQLIETYNEIKKRGTNFEIIFVSSDRSPESFESHLEQMPWLAVPFQHKSIRSELAQLFNVRGIPTLLLLDNNGHVITTEGRAEVSEDPLAEHFPWKSRLVNILTDRFAAKLQDFPAIILFVDGEETEVHFAESILTPSAEKYHKENNINSNASVQFYENFDENNYLQFLVGLENETSDVLRDLIGLDDVIPLLIALDIPRQRFSVMKYGLELTVETCMNFVEKFQKDELEFLSINERQYEN